MQKDKRDRLIDLLYEAEGQVNNDVPSLESMADYLIAHGVIVPPCKVGDTVYEFVPEWSKTPKIKERLVQKIEITSSSDLRITLKKFCPNDKSIYYTLDLNNIGKTVFFTKEQAEQKLKEMRVENV